MEEYTQITLDDWVNMKESLRKDLIGVQESFVRIGYTLRRMEDQRLYERDGYKNITEFAKAEYGLSASTVSRFKDINRRYSIDGYSDQLRPEYAQYGSSKLSEMLSLPEQDMEMVTPETTRESIRELKRFNREEPEAGVADDVRELIRRFYEDNAELLEELKASEAWNTGDTKELTEIVKPGDDRMYRKGLYFMVMYEKEIKIKKYGSIAQPMSWEMFFVVTRAVAGAMAPDVSENEPGQTESAMEEETAYEEIDAGTEHEEQAAVDKAECEPEEEASENEPERTETSGENEEVPTAAVREDKDEPSAEAGEDKSSLMAAVQGEKDEISAVQEDEEASVAAAGRDESGQAATVPEKEMRESRTEKFAPAQNIGKEGEGDSHDPERNDTSERSLQTAGEADAEAQTEKGEKTQETAGSDVGTLSRAQEHCQTRKAYMDTLTPYRMAHYMAEERERQSLNPSMLFYPSKLIEWLTQDVDGDGREIVDV